MGGCASRPKDLDAELKAPAPVEAPAAVDAPAVEADEKPKAETAPEEKKDEDEANKKEEPLIDISEEPQAAPKGRTETLSSGEGRSCSGGGRQGGEEQETTVAGGLEIPIPVSSG
ncbi:hypothetical protein Salat_0885600 [Sesamum alatum]|uniref:Uncharacterized protein n=1 Tax=Sesamum alatum TaxID=300844 RepID=A0AAE1YJ57_9LAMI|nr:hypothetical protein Salat_0885600 [Sesamum alatum]